MTSQPIRSVHITNYYHKNSGGISTSYNNLLDAANRHRRFVTLIVPGEVEEVEQVGEFGKICYIPARYSPVFDKRYRLMMPWQYMLKGSVIRKYLLDEMPDMIEVCDKYSITMLAAMVRMNYFKKLGRPMLVHFSCERMDDNVASFLARGRLGKWFARRVMSNYNFPLFDFHIANSPYTGDEFYEALKSAENPRRSESFLNWTWRFFKSSRVPHDERIFICPRGVNLARFSHKKRDAEFKKQIKIEYGITENAVLLLYAGRISPEKNIGLLAEFMKILAADPQRDFRLLVAGDGPRAEWLQTQANQHMPGKIILLGHLEKEKLALLYANCDVFVHPNPREPFGIAPLEAMASGAPVVAPNSGGLLSYAGPENAWLVEPTGENFATAVREIVADFELRRRKVVAALATAQNNTREIATDRLLATYDKMYEDFLSRKELFTNRDAAKEFDFAATLK